MKIFSIIFIIFLSLNIAGCNSSTISPPLELSNESINLISNNIVVGFNNIEIKTKKPLLLSRYSLSSPKEWGQNLNNILSKIPSTDKSIYLTFDACGGGKGGQLDRELINFLIAENIPSTLFINERWINNNLEEFKNLAINPLFQIENHGTSHKPLSVNGKSAYGIQGTLTLSELYDEVEINSKKIELLTGRKPKYFRSGTAFYDDIAVKFVNDMGYEIGGYNVLGDAGATFSKSQIISQFKNIEDGSIFLFHMNHPEGNTFEGIQSVVPKLKSEGWTFKLLP